MTVSLLRIVPLALWLAGLVFFGSRALADPLLVMADESPPYMGEGLRERGFLPALITEAMARQKTAIKIRVVPWARAIENVRLGKADAILGVYHTEERAVFLDYSEPVTVVRTVLFSLKANGIRYSSLEDLRPYSIGVVRGSSYGPGFDQADYLDKHEVSQEILNVRKLLKRRIDLFAGSADVLWYLIRTEMPEVQDDIEMLSPPLAGRQLYVGFSRKVAGHGDHRRRFNAGLSSMIADGTLKSLGEEHGVIITQSSLVN